MNIKDFKFDINKFEGISQISFLAKQSAERVLKEEEARVKENFGRAELSYYDAYYNYMCTDDAHEINLLNYIKYFYEEMMHAYKVTNDEIALQLAQKTSNIFDEFYALVMPFKQNEKKFKQALDNHKASKIMVKPQYHSDLMAFAELHMVLMECDLFHLTQHTKVDDFKAEKLDSLFNACETRLNELMIKSRSDVIESIEDSEFKDFPEIQEGLKKLEKEIEELKNEASQMGEE